MAAVVAAVQRIEIYPRLQQNSKKVGMLSSRISLSPEAGRETFVTWILSDAEREG